jgi:hypothetical protein
LFQLVHTPSVFSKQTSEVEKTSEVSHTSHNGPPRRVQLPMSKILSLTQDAPFNKRHSNNCIILAQNKMAMQEDKVLFTEKVPAGKRTYFFDVKENHQGTRILKITESRKNEGEFIRHSLMVFQEDFDKIFEAFDKARNFIQSSKTE